jgi:asparagine synthetase B (glutamine-hydrolysing)
MSIARDQFGIKPLYYGIIDQWFVFGSQIRILLATELFPIEQDCEVISQYTTFFAYQVIKQCLNGSNLLIKGAI